MDLLISILLDKITEAINTNVSDSPTRATDAYWGFSNEMELGSGPYAIHYD